MKIGILQTGHAPETIRETMGDYDAMFHRLLGEDTFEFTTYNVVDMQFPTDVDAADGWLITGSKHGAYEDHAFIPPLEALIRAIHARRAPMIGVCFGHQIIAQTLGGKVEKFAGGWSVGRTEYQLDGRPVALNAWHQDQVVQVPPSAEIVGHSDFCAAAALLYDDTIWTIQPHPEFGAPIIEELATTRGPGIVPQDQLDAATTQLSQPTDNAALGTFMAEFFRKERA